MLARDLAAGSNVRQVFESAQADARSKAREVQRIVDARRHTIFIGLHLDSELADTIVMRFAIPCGHRQRHAVPIPHLQDPTDWCRTTRRKVKSSAEGAVRYWRNVQM